MNHQEVADALVEKFLNQAIDFPYIDTQDGRCIGSGYMTYNSAKACAIICVDMLLKENPERVPSSIDINGQVNPRHHYWQSIKQILETK